MIDLMNRRGRVGRGGRIIIDRLSEPKPRFGNMSHEIYRGTLPMAAVRYKPSSKDQSGSLLPDLTSLDAPVSNMVMAPVVFNRCAPEKLSVKRSYQEVMPSETALPYCNIDTSLSFNLASEMLVRVDPVKRLILSRNTANDQVQFFL
jgi:singapore isolate B (sub-type 7) whole genome shotgun sequence assembly, scaffold_2